MARADGAQVEAWALKQKVDLPADMLQTAQKFGLRASALTAYVKLQVRALPSAATSTGLAIPHPCMLVPVTSHTGILAGLVCHSLAGTYPIHCGCSAQQMLAFE
jgi:hypothetical protein